VHYHSRDLNLNISTLFYSVLKVKPIQRESEVSSNEASISGTCNTIYGNLYGNSNERLPVVRTIADNLASPGLPVFILGKIAFTKTQDQADGYHKSEVVQVESLEILKDSIRNSDSAGLIITRDRKDITHDDISDLLYILGPTRFLLLWPSDEMIDRFIWSVASSEKADTNSYHNDHDDLQSRIATLESKNASLEATVRTLVAALSQYDPWPEVYTSDKKAWDLIIQNIPVADQDQEEFDQPYDENSEEDEEF